MWMGGADGCGCHLYFVADTMKFNQKELACYASAKSGKADKEGFLYMKESEKKKEGECGSRLRVFFHFSLTEPFQVM